MTPSKCLIAQRLAEHAREGYALADLMTDYISDPDWLAVANALMHGADTEQRWAAEIRKAET
jgi:hypothetical protein